MNLGLIFLGVGGLSLLLAIIFFMRTRRFLGGAVSVQGSVLNMVARSGSEGGVVYSPTVQFTTVEGQTHMFTDSVGTNPPRYTPGQTVKVMYTPGDPGSARIPSWFRLWFLSTFFALFGVGFLGGGVFTFDSTPASGEIPDVAGLPIPENVESLIPQITPGEGDFLVIQDGSGPARVLSTTCQLRDRNRTRVVRLTFEGGELTFTASPYTGPGPYTAGDTLEVEGTVFESGADISGAAIFEESGETGVVNLVAGDSSASGAWDCS